jgi:predicted DNA binding CopG/RHH family protein
LFNVGVTTLKKRDSRIGIRLPAKDVLLVKRICRSRGEHLSDFLRRAIRTELARLSFLKPEEKKALGVKDRT